MSLVLRGWVTTGPYRRTLMHEAATRRLEHLKTSGSGHSSKIAGECGRRMVQYCHLVQRSRDAQLSKFSMLAIGRWLPTEANLSKRDMGSSTRAGNHGRGPTCKLCGAPEETVEHALCDCVGTHTRGDAMRRLACARAMKLLENT